jgi:hypothetical protein
MTHEPSAASGPRPADPSLPARQGGEATWPATPDGTAPSAGIGSWPISAPEAAKRPLPRADLVAATLIVIALLLVGGLYVAGVLDREDSQTAPTPARTSTSPITAPANPFAP